MREAGRRRCRRNHTQQRHDAGHGSSASVILVTAFTPAAANIVAAIAYSAVRTLVTATAVAEQVMSRANAAICTRAPPPSVRVYLIVHKLCIGCRLELRLHLAADPAARPSAAAWVAERGGGA